MELTGFVDFQTSLLSGDSYFVQGPLRSARSFHYGGCGSMGSVSLRSGSKREFYLEAASDMHHRASSETTPQAKEILLDIERSLQRLAEIESWSDQRVRFFAPTCRSRR
jgi:hypothetical protein